MKEIVNVNFGGSVAIYVDGKLEFFRKGSFRHDDLVTYLLNNIHINFKPIQTINISEYSTYWEKVTNSNESDWIPDLSLSKLKNKLNTEYDTIF